MKDVSEIRAYPVWDRTTRLFHWINFVCVVALATIGTAILYNKALGVSTEGKILLKTVHAWFGYVLAANLAWRLVWAFIGNRYARWRAILPFGRGFAAELRAYVAGLRAGDPPPYAGHNPAARIMVAVLLALLIVQAATGLVLAGTDIYYPPFGHWIAGWVAAPGVDPATLVPYDETAVDAASYDAMRALRTPFITVHYWTFFLLLIAIAAHVAGVVVTETRHGGAIVSAMFTGRKLLDKPPVDGPKA